MKKLVLLFVFVLSSLLSYGQGFWNLKQPKTYTETTNNRTVIEKDSRTKKILSVTFATVKIESQTNFVSVYTLSGKEWIYKEYLSRDKPRHYSIDINAGYKVTVSVIQGYVSVYIKYKNQDVESYDLKP